MMLVIISNPMGEGCTASEDIDTVVSLAMLHIDTLNEIGLLRRTAVNNSVQDFNIQYPCFTWVATVAANNTR